MTESVLFGLLAFIGWGIGDIYITFATRKIGGDSTTFWLFIFSLLIFSLVIPFELLNLFKLDLMSAVFLIFLILIQPIPLILYFEALKLGNPALVGSIVSAFTAITVLLSVVFLQERLTILQAILVFVIFFGVFLSSTNIKSLFKTKLDKSLIFALISMVLWGIYFAFIKIPINKIGWFWPAYLSNLAIMPLLLYVYFKRIRIQNPFKNRILTKLILGILLISLAAFSYNAGIGRGLVAIVAPIAGSYPALFVILAFILFRNPITKQQILGIITTLIGIVLLSFFSI